MLKISVASLRRIDGIQLTGRHAWPDELTNAARAYAREPDASRRGALRSEQHKAAEYLVSLQEKLGFSYVTDGGFGLKDDFIPYIEKVKGVEGGKGQINQQPGTRNEYYFIPIVTGKLEPEGGVYEEYLLTDALPKAAKKKLIIASPLSLALASQATSYSRKVDLLYDFADIQKREVAAQSAHYDYFQLTESFSGDDRFSAEVTRDVMSAFRYSLDRIFKGTGVRSAVYFSSGNAIDVIPFALDSRVTDVGFDFNTYGYEELGGKIEKNLILGLQNITRKLPENLLADEPKRLAAQAREVLSKFGVEDGAEVFLGQSQGSDGLQTYPQAIKRDENLSKAFELLRGESK